MKFRKLTLLALVPALAICLSSCDFIQIKSNDDTSGQTTNPISNDPNVKAYYAEISSDLSGNNLLNALRTLNGKKRTKTVGYNEMGTSASGKFKFTDYDPKTVQINDDGVPYGTSLLSFYTGKRIVGKCTREHVWPASRLPGGRDGNIVDDDIYMPRPELEDNNGDRGNCAYGTSGGTWDPVTEFGISNCYKGTSIRGECARIVFYCMLVDSRLVLDNNTYAAGNNMGRIDELVQWSVDNPVNDRENRRNVGGQYLQGNRNAFVDHPEYVCKIWGNTTEATKKACGLK